MARRTLSQEVKDGILNGLRNGESPAKLAGQFGVSIPTVYNYKKSQVTTTTAPVETTPSIGTASTTVVAGTRKAAKQAVR